LDKLDEMAAALTEVMIEASEGMIMLITVLMGLLTLALVLWICSQIWRLIWSHMIQVWF
jgi:hypothetical protein